MALLEKAAKEEPDNPKLRMALAAAYLRVPDESKALEQFHRVLNISQGAMVLNAVASAMADSGHLLGEAQQYAGQAVAEVEKDTLIADLNSAGKQDFARMMHLAAAWDTFGWANFRSGEVDRARKYTEAAWMLLQTAVTGEHLVEIYEKQGQTEKAKRICHMALATFQISKEKQDDARKKLTLAWKRLTGQDKSRSGDGDGQTFALSGPGPVELSELRAVKVPLTIPLKGESLSAAFAISFLNGPEGVVVEQPKFQSGSEDLRAAALALRAAHYRQPFPGAVPARILRTGILHCSKYLKECTLVLTPLDSMVVEKLLSPVE